MRSEGLLILFDRIGDHVLELLELQERWPTLSPEQRLAAANEIFEPKARIQMVGNDFQAILDTLYDASARGCTMKVIMKA